MPPLLPRAQFPLPLQRIVLRKDKDRPEDVREIPSGEKGAGVGDRKQEPRGPVPSLDIQSPSGPNTPPDGIRLRNWLLGKSVPLSQQEVWRNERAAVKVHDSQVTQPGFGSAS